MVAITPAVAPAPTFASRMTARKKLAIIASPNGTGMTTFACEFRPNHECGPVFVNADLIAAGISPFQPRKCFGCGS